jgi:hypothetical protein
MNTVAQIDDKNMVLEHGTTDETQTQFVLDPSSMNLPNGYRLSTIHPKQQGVLRISCDWCFALNSRRTTLLKQLDLPKN